MAHAKLNVIATTTDMGALVESVGGDQVKIFTVAKGTQDPHHIDPKPSFMVKFHQADLVVAQGLELESAWLDSLVKDSRNPKIVKGSKGFLELGQDLDPLEKPQGPVSRAEGDVHPGGNPHFQLDPLRMGQAALLVAQRLADLDPENGDVYRKNATVFKQKMEEKTKEWQKRVAQSGIKEIVTHHKTLTYFCKRFGIVCDLQLEPKPGIPPTAKHLLQIISQMKLKNLRLVLIENYFDDDSPEKLRTEIPQLHVDRVPVSVSGEPQINTLPELYERLVLTFEKAVQK